MHEYKHTKMSEATKQDHTCENRSPPGTKQHLREVDFFRMTHALPVLSTASPQAEKTFQGALDDITNSLRQTYSQ